MKNHRVRTLTTMAMLVALEVVISRFCSIATPIVKIGFAFLPIAVMGILFGPVWAGVGAAAADLIGATLFPIAAYFPGFTLTAFMTGATYGALLRGGKCGWQRVLLATAVVTVAWNLLLNTYWLYLITGKGFLALLPTRLVKCLIMAPVEAATIHYVSARVLPATAGRAAGPHGLNMYDSY